MRRVLLMTSLAAALALTGCASDTEYYPLASGPDYYYTGSPGYYGGHRAIERSYVLERDRPVYFNHYPGYWQRDPRVNAQIRHDAAENRDAWRGARARNDAEETARVQTEINERRMREAQQGAQVQRQAELQRERDRVLERNRHGH